MGDFYELFYDDAIAASRALGLTLTERTPGVPMAGVPYHAVDTYLKRLIDQGFRVAVCEQMEDPKQAKGVVKRAVTRVVTPGALTDDALLESAAPAAVAAVALPGARKRKRTKASDAADLRLGVACIETSTGAFTVRVCRPDELPAIVTRIGAREIIYASAERAGRAAPIGPDGPRASAPDPAASIAKQAAKEASAITTQRPAWTFGAQAAEEALKEQFRVATLEGFDLGDDEVALVAAGAVVRYVRETQLAAEDSPAPFAGGAGTAPAALGHLSPPCLECASDHLQLDAAAIRALEIERPLRDPGARADSDGSLLGLFHGKEGCRTPMGRRLLRAWLLAPLASREPIEKRHRQVATLVGDSTLAAELDAILRDIQDVARITGRLGAGRATPRDLVALGASIAKLDELTAALEGAPAFTGPRDSLLMVRETLTPVAAEINASCVESPPAHLRDGGVIRDGVDADLDEARSLTRDASTWLAAHQRDLAKKYDLPNLKVGYNRVFGYYLELPKAQAQRAPDAFSRRQTLKNAERYTTPELKAFEEKVTTAKDRALAREQRLFTALCEAAAAQAQALAGFARAVAAIDVVACFARKASRRQWTKPDMVDGAVLDIREGRHPAVEELFESDFTPNDLTLGASDAPARLALITGPNMAGKSTFIRQTALIVVLAQAGSFAPVLSATIGVVDRVYTRVGADDALHRGKSTFMVEMTEVAAALNGVTKRSLVILDEVGRGTSTLDGLALAWAIAEALSQRSSPRTLFATHYHELTALADEAPGRVRNLHVSAREIGDEIVFLHRVVPGRSDRSYGVHVARLAGMPRRVVERAARLLEDLAVTHEGAAAVQRLRCESNVNAATGDAPPQLSLFAPEKALSQVDQAVLGALREAPIEFLTPLDAFDLLRALRSQLDDAD